MQFIYNHRQLMLQRSAMRLTIIPVPIRKRARFLTFFVGVVTKERQLERKKETKKKKNKKKQKKNKEQKQNRQTFVVRTD